MPPTTELTCPDAIGPYGGHSTTPLVTRSPLEGRRRMLHPSMRVRTGAGTGYGSAMKRITFSGGSIVTGNAITAALLEYTTTVTDAENSVTVEVTVLEENGETSVHTLLLSPASQFDVADVEGIGEEEEATRFPVPVFPQIGINGAVDSNGDAGRTAKDFDQMMNEIDNGLGQ